MKYTIRAWFVNHGIAIDTGEKAWNTGRIKIDSFSKLLAQCSADELWKAELDLELAIAPRDRRQHMRCRNHEGMVGVQSQRKERPP